MCVCKGERVSGFVGTKENSSLSKGHTALAPPSKATYAPIPLSACVCVCACESACIVCVCVCVCVSV